jgi:hypothetical protein
MSTNQNKMMMMLVTVKEEMYRVFQKELYNFESL